MQELIPIIVDLLSKHTCVIIPDFGGFIVNEKSAVINPAGDHFFPPRKELIFNQHLSHNDGLLAHAFMQEKSVSFDEANQIITAKVKSAKRDLETHKIYSLGDFGFFSFEPTGIVFHAKEIQIDDPQAFGLREFYFPSLQKVESGSVSFSGYRNGITPSLSRTIMGGIAATIALFLFCQPLKNDGRTDMASLLPAVSFSENVFKEKALRESLKAKELSYYLVVEEAESEEDAFTFANSIELQQGDTLQVLPLGGKFLITFSSSLEPEKVNERMKDLHARYTAFPDAFVLGLE